MACIGLPKDAICTLAVAGVYVFIFLSTTRNKKVQYLIFAVYWFGWIERNLNSLFRFELYLLFSLPIVYQLEKSSQRRTYFSESFKCNHAIHAYASSVPYLWPPNLCELSRSCLSNSSISHMIEWQKPEHLNRQQTMKVVSIANTLKQMHINVWSLLRSISSLSFEISKKYSHKHKMKLKCC